MCMFSDNRIMGIMNHANYHVAAYEDLLERCMRYRRMNLNKIFWRTYKNWNTNRFLLIGTTNVEKEKYSVLDSNLSNAL